MSPHAPRAARAARWGGRAVSISDFPVSGRGRPPMPSSDSNTILVAFSTTSGAMISSITSPCALAVLDGVLERAEPGDFESADVAGLQEHGRFLPEADARRSGGREVG